MLLKATTNTVSKLFALAQVDWPYLDKDAAPYFKKAVQFYEELAKQMVNQGHVLDLFASALDQIELVKETCLS
ncbi:hypothetical protein L1987_11722 [Smallanthus sonchifolius]|uniref:Uncharacterized protein n=1 Tax=Smallanthus sonchifolius TaxID=185202 RepID=A0ACB9JCN4_9ASTR|nr:hypothetical protein L1987_11722 [Smallanthus sonchifolius]